MDPRGSAADPSRTPESFLVEGRSKVRIKFSIRIEAG